MHRLIVFGLLAVLLLGTCMSLSANTLEKNFMKMLSSSTPTNFIDHLPFTINMTDVYYITEDVEVNGTGITIQADNVVLLGQGHTIAGNGTGKGIYILGSNATVLNCFVKGFGFGILDAVEPSGRHKIAYNSVAGCGWGIVLLSDYDVVFGNIVIDNNIGVQPDGASSSNEIVNNYFDNGVNARTPGGGSSDWNDVKTYASNIIGGSYKGGNHWSDYTDQDSDGDGLGNTPYTIDTNNKDGLPLVDISPPHYDLETFNSSSPSVSLSITWKDNVQLDKVLLQLDGVNYTNSAKVSESFGFNEYYQVEHKATYASFFVLSVGPHTYRWYANDTSNHWNSTQLQSFNVIQTNINSIDISSTLKVSANITCQGAGNITEQMDTVDLQFNIDGTWYSKDMTYSPSTRLYSGLIPEYNQLANKTILVYVAAKTKQNQFLNSDVYIYHVPQWVAADLNRDGKVTILDIVKATSQYGKP